MSAEWRIAQPYCLALAPQLNSPEPIWYIGCKTLNGEDKMFQSQQFFDQNYPELSQWTKTIPNSARACRVTFGSAPYSYFACAPGRGSSWAGVPSELTDKVQKSFDTPSCVSLGTNEAWFALWPDGYFAWNFHGQYQELEGIFKTIGPQSIGTLALSPYNPQHFFLALKDGTVRYNFAGIPEWTAPIQEIMNQWQAELFQRQQRMQQLPLSPPLSPPLGNAQGQMQWNPQNGMPAPAPGAQVYVAAHYANAHPPAPGMPQYNAYANAPLSPPPMAIELPGSTLLEPPQATAPAFPPQQGAPRPVSILTEKKKKGFFRKAFGKS
ncbi:hypothetical protein BU24DRAFT_417859 [Aaosphaeria arxii CBS 175.79]|uniref:Uncharacterized protein n=1 Tax=Aaosphaeria arxii CBS 175.79 TaxID=1450172 RepID=A0A6A5YAH1_9PLEO|nr:uncharacterized protein BU24DRAFT_417859 [Aaosphaeria arxii CBS 175.79]KAF2022226.1 hypothetical protein BU24DRAFT_417859 [Aaosphaeria arxii CBS 175.79]